MKQKPHWKGKNKFLSNWYVILTALLLGIYMLILLIASWPTLYAFFSDKIGATTTITASNMGVMVTEVETKKLVYGGGSDAVYPEGFFSVYNTLDVGITLADGYVLPVQFTVKNTGKLVEDITEQISLVWNTNNFLGQETNKIFYVYDSTAKEEDIVNGTVEPLGTFVDGKWTGKTYYNVEPGGTFTASYKILFKRLTEVGGKIRDNTVIDWKKHSGVINITPGAKAIVSNDLAPNWTAEDGRLFKIVSSVFATPETNGYILSSDNVIESNNTITGLYDTASGGGNLFGRYFPYPNYYEVKRNESLSGYRMDENKGTFIDNGIPWLTQCIYTITSYDDYGIKIATGKDNTDACDGGFVEMPDENLRKLIKPFRKDVEYNKIDTDAPITVNNFQLGSKNTISYKNPVAGEKITSLEGLQFLKPFFPSQVINIYFDDNNIESIVGYLPEIMIKDLSLSGNLKIPDTDLKELSRYKDSLQRLYMRGMDISSLDALDWSSFTVLIEIGLSQNYLTDVSMLNNITSLQELNLSDNKLLTNVEGLFGWSDSIGGVSGAAGYQLPDMIYYNVNGCGTDSGGLTAGSKNYIATQGTGVYQTRNFPDGCRVAMGSITYVGIPRNSNESTQDVPDPETESTQQNLELQTSSESESSESNKVTESSDESTQSQTDSDE